MAMKVGPRTFPSALCLILRVQIDRRGEVPVQKYDGFGADVSENV